MNQRSRTPKHTIELAKEMRKNLTPSEKVLWHELQNKKLNGYKFRNQHPISRYILDFYCHKCLLAVEIDGDFHKFRKDYDEYRDKYMESVGIKTLRFTNEDIFNNLNLVLKKIKENLESRLTLAPLRGVGGP